MHTLAQRYTRHYPALLRTGLPIMVGNLSIVLITLTDTLMVSHYGLAELSASGFVNNIVGIFSIAGLGFSCGLVPIASKLYGERQTDLLAGKLKNAMLANMLVCGLILGVLGLFYIFIDRLGQPQELVPLMRPYLLLLMASLVPHTAFDVLKQFSDAIQETRIPMVVNLVAIGLNVVFNWMLIYGHCGLPALGLTGAGIATALSRLCMLLILSGAFVILPRYRTYLRGLRTARLCLADTIENIKMGSPIALQMGLECSAFLFTALFVGWIGVTALAAHHIMLGISQFGYMIYYGIDSAVAILEGFAIGEGRKDEVRYIAAAGLHLCLITAILSASVLLVLRHDVSFLFTTDPELCALVSMLIWVFAFYQPGDVLQSVYCNALRGIGDVHPLSWIAFVSYFVIAIPTAYLLGFPARLGLVGIWLSTPVGLYLAGLLYYLRFRKATR